jgi:hypothetical protein
MDFNVNYFYLTYRFSPAPEDFGLIHVGNSLYKSKKDDALFRKTLSYDFGMGQEVGYERIPELEFSDLIALSIMSDINNSKLSVREEEMNRYGAVAVIMQRYVIEFILFLSENINDITFRSNKLYKKNLKVFCFDKDFYPSWGGVGTQNYIDILNHYPKWREISSDVTSFVYS